MIFCPFFFFVSLYLGVVQENGFAIRAFRWTCKTDSILSYLSIFSVLRTRKEIESLWTRGKNYRCVIVWRTKKGNLGNQDWMGGGKKMMSSGWFFFFSIQPRQFYPFYVLIKREMNIPALKIDQEFSFCDCSFICWKRTFGRSIQLTTTGEFSM